MMQYQWEVQYQRLVQYQWGLLENKTKILSQCEWGTVRPNANKLVSIKSSLNGTHEIHLDVQIQSQNKQFFDLHSFHSLLNLWQLTTSFHTWQAWQAEAYRYYRIGCHYDFNLWMCPSLYHLPCHSECISRAKQWISEHGSMHCLVLCSKKWIAEMDPSTLDRYLFVHAAAATCLDCANGRGMWYDSW